MPVLSKKTKSQAGAKAAKAIASRRADQIGEATRDFRALLAAYGTRFMYEMGLAEPPKRKRTAPRVAAGLAIGAGAVYFLEPKQGPKHRKKVAQLVS